MKKIIDKIIQFYSHVDTHGPTSEFSNKLRGRCHLWLGAKNMGGYGVYQKTVAHKFIFQSSNGKIPKGLYLDHLCRVRNCVNINHLEVVTHKVNMERGAHAMKTHCPYGHPYIKGNLVKLKYGRACLTCLRINSRKRRTLKAGTTVCIHGTPKDQKCIIC